MREAIKQRISRRKFTPEAVDCRLWQKLRGDIAELNSASGLTMELVEDGADAFSSMKKSYGMFSGVQACAVLKGSAKDPDLQEKIGYYGEELVLRMTEYGLGSCWVAGTFDRSCFTIPDGQTMVCVIPFGYTDKPSLKEKAIRGAISRKRKPAKERMTGFDAAPEWAQKAMEAVVLAPSAVNSQKPMFHWETGIVRADVPQGGHVDLVDLGIAKKHFEIEAGGRFPMGNGAVFQKNP